MTPKEDKLLTGIEAGKILRTGYCQKEGDYPTHAVIRIKREDYFAVLAAIENPIPASTDTRGDARPLDFSNCLKHAHAAGAFGIDWVDYVPPSHAYDRVTAALTRPEEPQRREDARLESIPDGRLPCGCTYCSLGRQSECVNKSPTPKLEALRAAIDGLKMVPFVMPDTDRHYGHNATALTYNSALNAALSLLDAAIERGE